MERTTGEGGDQQDLSDPCTTYPSRFCNKILDFLTLVQNRKIMSFLHEWLPAMARMASNFQRKKPIFFSRITTFTSSQLTTSHKVRKKSRPVGRVNFEAVLPGGDMMYSSYASTDWMGNRRQSQKKKKRSKNRLDTLTRQIYTLYSLQCVYIQAIHNQVSGCRHSLTDFCSLLSVYVSYITMEVIIAHVILHLKGWRDHQCPCMFVLSLGRRFHNSCPVPDSQ